MRDIVPRFIYVFDLETDKMARISSLNKTTPSFKQNGRSDLTPLHGKDVRSHHIPNANFRLIIR